VCSGAGLLILTFELSAFPRLQSIEIERLWLAGLFAINQGILLSTDPALWD